LPSGASYNPAYDDHQNLLAEALKIEKERVKKEERVTRATDEKFPSAQDAPNEVTWLKEMSSGLFDDTNTDTRTETNTETTTQTEEFTGEELMRLSNNPPVRREDKKTEKQRRKEKEAELKKQTAMKEKKEKIRKQEIFRLKSVKREVRKRMLDLDAKSAERQVKKELTKNRTKKLGRIKFVEPTIAVKLSEELEGSLRLLKPEGHVLEDQFKSLQRRNIIEPRLRAKHVQKYRPKAFEKKTHRSVTE